MCFPSIPSGTRFSLSKNLGVRERLSTYNGWCTQPAYTYKRIRILEPWMGRVSNCVGARHCRDQRVHGVRQGIAEGSATHQIALFALDSLAPA